MMRILHPAAVGAVRPWAVSRRPGFVIVGRSASEPIHLESRSHPIHIEKEQPVAHPSALKPFDPGQLPIYYGWIILAASILGMIFSIPGQTMGVSVFTDHLIRVLGLSRVRISTAYMAGTFASSLLMTRAGRLYDRFGARTTGAGAVVFLALFLLFLSRVDVVAGALSGSWIVGFVLVTLGFLGIRFFGQGVLTLVSRTMMMRWFEERRGRVAAYSGIAVSASFAYAPRVLQSLIVVGGWRGAWGILAMCLAAFALPMVLILFRDTPERCGITMERGLKHLAIHKKNLELKGPDATLKEARGDLRYWAYALMLSWWSMYNTAFTFHIVDIFASRGVGADAAVAIFLPITIISVTFSFFSSWISDAIALAPLYFLTVAGYALSGAGIIDPSAPWSTWAVIGGLGMSGGIWSVLNTVTWPRLFGREHLGEISGSVMGFIVAGSALGPFLFSVLRSPSGSYVGAGVLGLAGSAALGLFGAFVFLKGRRVQEA